MGLAALALGSDFGMVVARLFVPGRRPNDCARAVPPLRSGHSCNCANTALAIAIAPSALAQDAPVLLAGTACRCPDEPTGKLLIQNVQRTPASAFDQTAPTNPFRRMVLVGDARAPRRVPPSAFYAISNWRSGAARHCPDITSAAPDASSSELCVNGTVVLSAEKQVKIVIAVADAVRGATTGSLRWRPKQPSLREVYIERLNRAD